MTVLEIVLLITIIVLIFVLLLETREYKKVQDGSGKLSHLVDQYSAAYTAISLAVNALNEAVERGSEEHQVIARDIIFHDSILEIHNRALQLNPSLLKNDGEKIL